MSAIQHLKSRKLAVVGALMASFLVLVALIAKGVPSKAAESPTPATSVIILSGDGMGIHQRKDIQ